MHPIRAARPLWVCARCIRQAPRQPPRRWISAVSSSTSPADARVRPASHSAPGQQQDDAVLRDLFDAPRPTVSSWSAAASSAFGGPNVGLFRNRYLTRPSGFLAFARRTLTKAQAIVARVLAARSDTELRAVVADLDRLSDLLCRVLDLSDFVRMTHPDAKFQRAAADAWGIVYQYMNQLNTMTGLYDQLVRAMGEQAVARSWSDEERTVADILRLDFTKSAVDLPKKSRDRFVELSQQISEVGLVFSSDMEPARPVIKLPSSKLFGLYPGMAREITRGGQTRLPTLGSEAVAALRSVHDEDVRREIYVATRTASARTVELLETMLRLRAELAALAGFGSYADLALKDRMMAKTPASVMQFLLALHRKNRPVADDEFASLLRRKRELTRQPDAMTVHPWDREYLMESIRTEMRTRRRQPDALSAYFSVGTVMQGLSRLFSRLYGIRFVPRETLPGETWHPDVRRLDVVADDAGSGTGEQLVAVLYCDLFFRPDKSPNPAHFTVRCARDILEPEIDEARRDLEAGADDMPAFETAEEAANDGMARSVGEGTLKQLPTIALVCDFSNQLVSSSGGSGGGAPALLSFHQVETLFHEMGHAAHSILARTALQNVAGTRCATDLAELPSTLMEHFAADPAVLALFARHWRTGEPLAAEAVADQVALARRFEGCDAEHQIVLAMLDQSLHSYSGGAAAAAGGGNVDSTAVFHDLQARYARGGPDPAETCWQGFFGHLHGYGSTYYSYLFDRVLAERVWRVVFAGGEGGAATERERGERLKETLLRWGGSRDPWRCLADALGEERLAGGDETAMALVGSWGLRDGR